MRSICPEREECAYLTNIGQWLITSTFAIAIVCLSSLTGSNSTSANAQNPNPKSECSSTSQTSAPAEEEQIGGASPMYWFFGGHPILGLTSFGMAKQLSDMLTAKIMTGTQTATSTNVALNPGTNTQAGGPCTAAAAPKQ